MQGISLDNAKRLQELGVPCAGYPVCSGGDYAPRCEMESGCDEPYYYLCQLLEEVEKRGYKFNMGNMKLNYWKSNYWFNCNLGSQVHISKEAPTKEDAVAQALIQILGEE